MFRLFRLALIIIAFLGILPLWAKFLYTKVDPVEKVGIVNVDGAIGSRKAEQLIKALEMFREDKNCKAIILRVNSPGGSVAPSQEVYEKVKKVVAEKPVVASFGAMAASGGYYLSLPSSVIIANEGSLTGSIGVVLSLKNFTGALEKLGVEDTTIKTGTYKDSGSPTREMTDLDREYLQSISDDTYAQFVAAVAHQRDMSIEEAMEAAEGKVYTGRQALKVGLVDQLGTFEDAVDLAAKLGGIEGKPKKVKAVFNDGNPLKTLLGAVAENFGVELDALDTSSSLEPKYILQY